jgi:hypothetical protein
LRPRLRARDISSNIDPINLKFWGMVIYVKTNRATFMLFLSEKRCLEQRMWKIMPKHENGITLRNNFQWV